MANIPIVCGSSSSCSPSTTTPVGPLSVGDFDLAHHHPSSDRRPDARMARRRGRIRGGIAERRSWRALAAAASALALSSSTTAPSVVESFAPSSTVRLRQPASSSSLASRYMAVTDPETLLRGDFALSPPPPSSIATIPLRSPQRVVCDSSSAHVSASRRSAGSASRMAAAATKRGGSNARSDKDAAAATERLEALVAAAPTIDVEAEISAGRVVPAPTATAAVSSSTGMASRTDLPSKLRTLQPRTRSKILPRSAPAATKTAIATATDGNDEADGNVREIKLAMMTPPARAAAPTSRSKSSTMPGFGSRNNDTYRRRAFRDGVRIAERRSGNRNISRVLRGKTRTAQRRKASSDAMYNNAASVPDSLVAFTDEIHRESRITPTEEIELGVKTQEAIRLQNLYDNLRDKVGREPTDAEWCAAAGKINEEALKQAVEDGIEAKNRLVTSNLRMVQGVVNLYIRNGLGSQYNAGDMMQEGTMALIRAAEKFEPKRGFRFSTYAMYWIRAAVKRSQILQSKIIYVPQRLHETHTKVRKVERELRAELRRKPTDEEVALACGLTAAQLERCRFAMDQRCFSLDAEIENTLAPNKNEGKKDTMYDVVDSKVDEVEYRKLQRLLMKDHLIDTLRRYLTPHEVDLILLRFGLMDEKTLPHGFSGPLTIAEVSRLVGLKPDKVRRMINSSLRQLKHLIANEWEDFENEIV